MTGPVDRDRQVEHLLRQSMPAGRPTSPRCVDAETLAAWSAGTLRREETTAVESHLADCADCQAMLAVFVDSEPAVAAVVVNTPFWQRWSMRWLVPVAAASAAVVLWTVVTREEVAVPAARTTMARAQPEPEARFQAPIDSAPAPQARTSPEPAQPTSRALAPSVSDAAAAAQENVRESTSAQRPADASQTVDDTARARQSAVSEESAAQSSSQLARAEPPPPPPPAAASSAPAPSPPTAGAQVTAAAPPVPTQVGSSANVAALRRGQNEVMTDGVSVLNAAVPLHARAGNVAVRFGAVPSPVRWTLHPDGRVERSADRGLTWGPVASVAATRLSAGSAPVANVCWLVGRDGVVWRSTDDATFARRPFPLTIALVTVEAQDATRAVVTSDDGRVFATADGGVTWQSRP